MVTTIAIAILVNKLATRRESIKLYPSQRNRAFVATEPIITSPSVPIPTNEVAPTFHTGAPPTSRKDPVQLPKIVQPRSPSRRASFQGRSSFTQVRPRSPEHAGSARASAAVLSGRTRVVSRVDSDTLHPEDNVQRRSYYRDAATGAKNAPSGMLKHYG